MRIGLINWNDSQLKSIKRDLLFFDKFYYNPELTSLKYNSLLEYFSCISGLYKYMKLNGKKDLPFDELKRDRENVKSNSFEIDSTIKFLTKRNLIAPRNIIDEILLNKNEKQSVYDSDRDELAQFFEYLIELNDIKALLESNVKDFSNLNDQEIRYQIGNRLKCAKAFDRLNNVSNRISSFLLPNKDNANMVPILSEIQNDESILKDNVLTMVIQNIPIPDDLVPLNEVIDFKDEHILKYKSLTRWMHKVAKDQLSLRELEDEVEYLTLEFENRMKLEKRKYKLVNLEIAFSLPLEIIESIIKLNWSKIPKLLLSFRKNKVDLLLSESKATGKEVAYLSTIKTKFNKAKNDT